jgi:hypothetical protein
MRYNREGVFMKKFNVLLVTLVILLAFGLVFVACDDGTTDNNNNNNGGYSLDGIWEDINNGQRITVSGSSGTLSSAGSNAIVQQMVDKGFLPIGGVSWRNITKTGNLTWSGQQLQPTGTSNPLNVTGTRWEPLSITMSADGQTINHGSVWKRKY